MLKIKQNLVSKEKYNIKCPYEMKAEYITVHNTENNASAENEIKYMITNNNQVSFHYAVDDKEIVQGIPEGRNAWHAGDGKNGTGNRKSIAIEICYSKGEDARFIQAELNAAKLIASLLVEKKWNIDKIKKHKDWSGKNCPRRTIKLGWENFLSIVEAQIKVIEDKKKEENKVQNVKITTTTSSTSNIVDKKIIENNSVTIAKNLQKALNSTYGTKLVIDGKIGPLTKNALKKYFVKYYKANDYVKWIQQQLKQKGYKITVDGKYGLQTRNVVFAFQKSNKLKIDGIVGYNTALKLI